MRLALTRDTAAVVGEFAEAVENRSLLLDKFVCHKRWPSSGTDDASRWSFMRVSANGEAILNRNVNDLERRANGRNTSQENRKKFSELAKVARSLARTSLSKTEAEMQRLQQDHARRLLALLEESPFASKTVVARLEARMAINLADGLIQNAGIALHRLFGLPYIPGSAVKGIARSIALQQLKNEIEPDKRGETLRLFISIFGASQNDFKPNNDLSFLASELQKADKQDQKGMISFLPAYAVDNTQIVVDITNVHTPEYYRSGNQADLQKEEPRPNPFPAVEAGARFAFCLVANRAKDDKALLEQAAHWLREGLQVKGIGAKTAAGYGWFTVEDGAASKKLQDEAHTLTEQINVERAKVEAEHQAKKERELKRAQMSPDELLAEDLWQQTGGKPEDIKGLFKTFPALDENKKKAVLILCRTQAKHIWAEEYAEYEKLRDNPKKQAKSKAFARVKAILDAARAMGETL